MTYKQMYIEYKNKYLQLKQQGGNNLINLLFLDVTDGQYEYDLLNYFMKENKIKFGYIYLCTKYDKFSKEYENEYSVLYSKIYNIIDIDKSVTFTTILSIDYSSLYKLLTIAEQFKPNFIISLNKLEITPTNKQILTDLSKTYSTIPWVNCKNSSQCSLQKVQNFITQQTTIPPKTIKFPEIETGISNYGNTCFSNSATHFLITMQDYLKCIYDKIQTGFIVNKYLASYIDVLYNKQDLQTNLTKSIISKTIPECGLKFHQIGDPKEYLDNLFNKFFYFETCYNYVAITYSTTYEIENKQISTVKNQSTTMLNSSYIDYKNKTLKTTLGDLQFILNSVIDKLLVLRNNEYYSINKNSNGNFRLLKAENDNIKIVIDFNKIKSEVDKDKNKMNLFYPATETVTYNITNNTYIIIEVPINTQQQITDSLTINNVKYILASACCHFPAHEINISLRNNKGNIVWVKFDDTIAQVYNDSSIDTLLSAIGSAEIRTLLYIRTN